jgi:hypothetical protein
VYRKALDRAFLFWLIQNADTAKNRRFG